MFWAGLAVGILVAAAICYLAAVYFFREMFKRFF